MNTIKPTTSACIPAMARTTEKPELLTSKVLANQNHQYRKSGGVSQENREYGFRPAFCDMQTGKAGIARFSDGSPSPIHILEGVPDEWVLQRSSTGSVLALKDSIVAGFLLENQFYTREQAAHVVM